MLITGRDMELLRVHMERTCGISLEESRRAALETFALERMEALGLVRFTDYLRLITLVSDPHEMGRLINALTVNETFFFRDYVQLTAFAEHALPELVARKEQAGVRSLRLLSAGCATGEEAYTLAIILREMIHDADSWDIRVEAVDIDTQVLDAARDGIYGPRSTRDVPISFRLAHFEPGEDDVLTVAEPVRRMVHFSYGNIHDPHGMARFAGLDAVFCRNVLIYFSDAARVRALNTFHDLMLPGAYIFLGYAESVSRFSGAFEVRRLGDSICHRRHTFGALPGSQVKERKP